MPSTYEWQRPFETAILETDRSRLPKLIASAQAAIDARIQKLSLDHRGSPDERQAIEDALQACASSPTKSASPRLENNLAHAASFASVDVTHQVRQRSRLHNQSVDPSEKNGGSLPDSYVSLCLRGEKN